MVRAFTGEILGQLARHVTARDAVSLVHPEAHSPREIRRLTRLVAERVSKAAENVAVAEGATPGRPTAWSAWVDAAFEAGQLRGPLR
jgi:hypothetical protein